MASNHHNWHIGGGPNRTKKPLDQSRVELYLQFEGCIRHTTLWELMISKNMTLPDTDTDSPTSKSLQLQDVISFMISRTQSSNSIVSRKLQLCLDVLLDDEEAVGRVCQELSEDCLRNGVKYFETSLNPYKLLGEKTSENANKLIRSVIASFKRAEELTNVKFGVILQYQKGMKEEANNLLSQCKELKEDHVVGLELAGTEFKIEDVIADDSENVDLMLFHQDDIAIFEEAKAAKIHRSVHAGEFEPSDAVFQAIEKLCAERVVGGYSVLEDESLYQDCINNKIHFCTTPSLSLINGSVGQDFFIQSKKIWREHQNSWRIIQYTVQYTIHNNLLELTFYTLVSSNKYEIYRV